MKTKSKLISIFIVLTMIVSIISTNMYSAFAEETDYITAEENNLNISLTNKSGVPLGGENSPSISNGDELGIKIAFHLKSTNFRKDKICVDLKTMEHISNLTGGNIEHNGNILGTFYINGDGILVIQYDWDMIAKVYADQDSFDVNLNIKAKSNYQDKDVNSEGNVIFKIKDKEYIVPNKDADSSLNVEKLRLGDGTNSDNIKIIDGISYQQFQIKVTSNGGDNTKITLKDTLGSNSLSFELNKPELKPTMSIGGVSKECSFLVEGQTAKIEIDELKKDQSAIITYWVKLSEQSYKESINESWKLKNKVMTDFTDNNNNKKENQYGAEQDIEVSNLSIQKSASDLSSNNKEKKVQWAVTITGGDNNIGYKFSDLEEYSGDKVNGKLNEASRKITIERNGIKIKEIDFAQLSQLQLADKDDLDNGKILLKKGEKLTLTYTNTYDIEKVDVSSGFFVKNTFKAEKENYPTISSTIDHTIVPSLNASILKEFQSYDLDNKEITWKVTIVVPSQFTNLLLSDIVGEGQSLIPNSLIHVKNDNTEEKLNFENNQISLDNLKDYFVETDGRHKYIFVYKTKDLEKTVTLTNKAILSYDYNGIKNIKSEAKYNKKIIINKTGYNDSDKGVQTWTIKFNLEMMNLDENSMIIRDKIPSDLELISDSFKLNGQEVELNISGAFEANITDVLKQYKKNHSNEKTVDLEYKTRIKDYKDLLNSQSGYLKYTNEVSGKYGNQEIDAVSASVDVYLNKWGLLNKSCSYDENNPTTLKYEVKINQQGVKLSKNDNDIIEVYDELGSALQYNEDNIKVYKGWGIDQDITSQVKIKVDKDANTLTISKIPDETLVRVVYTCTINLPAGTKINDSSAQELINSVTNKVQLRSTRNITSDSSTSFKGEVKSASGTMKPSNCTIKINKLDEDTLTQLKGAKFKIYMVKIEDGKFVEVQPREVTNYTGSKILETDDKGKLIDSNIMYDQYYCYEEIGNPKGYTGTVKGYVLFDGNEPKQNVESEIPEGTKLQRVYNYIGSISIDVKNKKVDTGELKITKTISGISSQTDLEKAKSSIKFKVTSKKNSDQVNEYTLNDFEYNESTKKWELKLNKEVGEYTVEEIAW